MSSNGLIGFDIKIMTQLLENLIKDRKETKVCT